MNDLLKIRISHQGEVALGPGKIELLTAIHQYGSISAAAKQMKMSYRRAWELVEVMNHSFVQPLVETNAGGTNGGGAYVTAFGFEVIQAYERLLEKSTKAAQQELSFIANQLKV